MARATTVRFSDEMFARLDQAAARTGMPVNSIVIAACLEWMQRHTPPPGTLSVPTPNLSMLAPAPRWATIRRAVVESVARRGPAGVYPFERFTATAQKFLMAAQTDAQGSGFSYIGTEHLLLAAFADSSSISARVLLSLGLSEQTIRSVVLDKTLRVKKPSANPKIVPTNRVKKVIELAFQLRGAAGDSLVNTGHILVALVTEGEGIAAQVLKDAGVTPDRIETAMDEITEPET